MTRTAASTQPSSSIPRSDEEEIRSLIGDQFDSLDWAPGGDGDWRRFEDGFLSGAQLFGAKRPAHPQSAQDFTSRLKRLRDEGVLTAFSEKGVGCQVQVIGSIAVAVAGCEMTENGTEVTRDVSMFLLVKNPEGWSLAEEAWEVVDQIPYAIDAAGLRTSGDER